MTPNMKGNHFLKVGNLSSQRGKQNLTICWKKLARTTILKLTICKLKYLTKIFEIGFRLR